ncbi:MAG: hypothetical protein WC875_01765 [Candidatus Absconditabacterales bacterium]
MKKNVIIIASIAGLGLTILTTAATFAATSNTGDVLKGTGHKIGNFMQGKGCRGGEGMMFGPEMEDFGSGERMGLGSGMGMILNQEKQGIQNAIEKNDYAAYLTAYEKAKLTKDQFAQMVKMNQSKGAIETAITNNDYPAYVVALQGTPMEGKVTQDQFKDMVAKHTQRTAERDAILNNNYSAYVAAVKGTPMEGKVTQEQFATMAQHRQRGKK